MVFGRSSSALIESGRGDLISENEKTQGESGRHARLGPRDTRHFAQM